MDCNCLVLLFWLIDWLIEIILLTVLLSFDQSPFMHKEMFEDKSRMVLEPQHQMNLTEIIG